MIGNFHEFGDRMTASEAAADWIAQAVEHTLAGQESASLVVSGGSTPVHCFAALAQTPLAWSRVSVFMSDERCVPPSHLRQVVVVGRPLARTVGIGQHVAAVTPGWQEPVHLDLAHEVSGVRSSAWRRS